MWPTPTASLGGKGGRVTPKKGKEGGTLIEAVAARMWPTPTVKGNHNKAGLSERSGDGLATAVNRDLLTKDGLLTTPCATDTGARSSAYKQGGKALSLQAGGPLNPPWVEWLMGWPIGWTGSAPVGMESFQQWRRAHSQSSLSGQG